ncbi:hypothetical protein NE237_021540 [Protea cynaroides]|uniref:DUF7950 domain-containing protein n=1 Tax=Protea cynaroides TaxID=273540 RepID=A0A9Q0HBG4_9MAGN|nr:hypothetical protein NE237_021540 [Protea cynaroides]
MVLMSRLVRPFVMVERVTEAHVDGEGLGNTDEERDTYPGFISDGLNMVEWTNKAYRMMIGEGEMVAGQEMVWLVTKERPGSLKVVTEVDWSSLCNVRRLFLFVLSFLLQIPLPSSCPSAR